MLLMAHLGLAVAREWFSIGLAYLAFREMGWFATAQYDVALERAWIRVDDLVLGSWHLKQAIEMAGALLPNYLEVCYLLVYGVAAYGLATIYAHFAGESRRQAADRFLTLYLLGTLLSYAVFPFYPSEPPRFAFPGSFAPLNSTLHQVNVRLLAAGTIRSGVFPSAHVSSAFSAAWAMLFLLPTARRYGVLALVYAVSVAVATVYGRYHYAADALAGVGISLLPLAVALAWKFRGVYARPVGLQHAGEPGLQAGLRSTREGPNR